MHLYLDFFQKFFKLNKEFNKKLYFKKRIYIYFSKKTTFNKVSNNYFSLLIKSFYLFIKKLVQKPVEIYVEVYLE